MNRELHRAASRLARDPRVVAVYGFGSRARGQHSAASDIDVAVLLDRRLSLREELRLRSEVVEELHRDDVDLVTLNQAPPLLRYEVVSAGQRLFTRDPDLTDRFEARAALECFDTEYLRSTQQQLARESSR